MDADGENLLVSNRGVKNKSTSTLIIQNYGGFKNKNQKNTFLKLCQ